MRTHEFGERTVLLLIPFNRSHLAPQFSKHHLAAPGRVFASERLLCHFGGINAEAFGLRIQIGIQGNADGLLRCLSIVVSITHGGPSSITRVVYTGSPQIKLWRPPFAQKSSTAPP